MVRSARVRYLLLAFGLAVPVSLVTVPSHAQMSAPPIGAKYFFDCSLYDGPIFQEVHSIAANDDGVIRVTVSSGEQENWYEKPFYYLGTTLVKKESIGGSESTMRGTDAFADIGALRIGDTFSDYVTERRAGGELEWKYKISVVGRETSYVRDLGDVPVIQLIEGRWFNLYSPEMLSYYAPDLSFPIYWSYTDSNQGKVECELASVERLEPAAVAEVPPEADQVPVEEEEIAALPPEPAVEEPAPPPEPRYRITPADERRVTSTRVNVRIDPSVNAAPLGLVAAGTTFLVTGKTEAEGALWYRVASTPIPCCRRTGWSF